MSHPLPLRDVIARSLTGYVYGVRTTPRPDWEILPESVREAFLQQADEVIACMANHSDAALEALGAASVSGTDTYRAVATVHPVEFNGTWAQCESWVENVLGRTLIVRGKDGGEYYGGVIRSTNVELVR